MVLMISMILERFLLNSFCFGGRDKPECESSNNRIEGPWRDSPCADNIDDECVGLLGDELLPLGLAVKVDMELRRRQRRRRNV